MIKISDEEIKEIIKKKNDKIEFISSKMIVKGNKHRRLVTNYAGRNQKARTRQFDGSLPGH